MHRENFITKIEGHGSIEIDLANKKAQLKILEGERLFEGILVGRTASEAAWITSRICGVCPIAHNLASLKTVEAALGITPNRTTVLLRKLMIAAQMLQSHTLHLFFLALPDYLGIDSGLELRRKNPNAFKTTIILKEIGDELAKATAGRNVHPTTTTIGGFLKIPSKKTLENLSEKMSKNIKFALSAAQIFSRLKYPQYQVNLELVSQTDGQNYPDCQASKIISNKNEESSIENYQADIQEEIRKNSSAKFSKYRQREVMVGALARLATHQKEIEPICQEYLQKIDFQNPFHNNLAQAVEILHYYKKAQKIINLLLQEEPDLTIVSFGQNPSLKGIGAVEAPRGGLYHEIHLNEKKEIIFANIITPTVQNLTSIEKSANLLLEQTPNLNLAKAKKLLEMLVRAYDPCLTCAVH